MWSVVAFDDDESVEAVPAYWFQKDKCAWPKKNYKKFLDRRIQPNEVDFDYLPARKLGKNVDSYLIAREKAKKAENTSDISTHESSQENHSNFSKSAKQFKKIKMNNGKKVQDTLWSPCSDFHSEGDDSYNTNQNYTSEEQKPSETKYSLIEVSSAPTLKALSNDNQRSSKVKKQLIFDTQNHSQSSLSNYTKLPKLTGSEPAKFLLKSSSSAVPNTITEDIGKSQSNFCRQSEIILMPSSPFKISNVESDEELINSSQSDFYGQSKIISTSSSPFKISNIEIEGFTASQSNVFHQLSSNTPVLSSSDKNDILHKLNRNVLNMKYDIKTLIEKNEKLEELILNMSTSNNNFWEYYKCFIGR